MTISNPIRDYITKMVRSVIDDSNIKEVLGRIKEDYDDKLETIGRDKIDFKK
jgi:hypothetical protein